jgi:DNA-binding MarR family transcriptional regulator
VGDRRQELVSFNPRELDVNDELDGESIAHALRELNRLESFTYVPAFRGRAIRMIRRDLPFEELEIDFAALEERKAAELERLERTIAFATSRSCRQQAILRYFGEADAPQCGHCDNCPKKTATGGGAPIATTGGGFVGGAETAPKVLETVRMVLSGVARTQARVACGKNVIAQMLCGSASAKVKKLNFDKLSTYGLLKHLKQADVVTLIEALIAVGLLEQSEFDRFRPVVELTPAGAEVMRGAAPLDVALPIPDELLWKIRYSYPGPEAVAKAESGGRKAEGGREKREGRRGKAEGIAELANDEMWHGNAVAEYEPHVPRETVSSDLAADASFAASARVRRDAAAPAADTTSPIRSSHYWTWRLLVAGFSPAECAAIRGMTSEAVLDDAVRAAESGWSVRPEWFLGPELLATLSRVVAKEKSPDARTLLTRLPPGTREAEVSLYLKCRAAGGD